MQAEILITAAMKEEICGLLEAAGARVLYTGLGKVNATHILSRELGRLSALEQTPRLVVNFGTAGSPRFPTHSVVECTRFVQRDMDVSALGFAPGVTPFDVEPAELSVPRVLTHLPLGVCGTGDRFETTKPVVDCDVVDMEAYALAKVALREQVPFLSVKYITDGSDANAHNDWAENLPRAAAEFHKIYLQLKATVR